MVAPYRVTGKDEAEKEERLEPHVSLQLPSPYQVVPTLRPPSRTAHWDLHDGPNESPFFAGLYFARFASSKDGFDELRPGSPPLGDQTSSLTAWAASVRVVKRAEERFDSA
jgi:hypothetical protein